MKVYAIVYQDKFGLTRHKETNKERTAYYWEKKYKGYLIYLYSI